MRVVNGHLATRIQLCGAAAQRSLSRANVLLTCARTTIALAQLTLLLSTRTEQYFVPVGEAPPDAKCAGAVSRFSAFCWDGVDRQLVAYVLVALLLVVASGWHPRWSSWVHYFATFSISTAIALPDGGDQAVMCVALWLALASLSDGRRWGWTRSGQASAGLPGVSGAVSIAAIFALRLQMAYIYLNSATAKFPVDAWQDGTAMYYVARMENFGSVTVLGDLLRHITEVPLLSAGITWGTMSLELLMAFGLVVGRRWIYLSVFVAVALHGLIAVFLGLVSFALIMLGAVVAAASLHLANLPDDLRALRSAPVERHEPTADEDFSGRGHGPARTANE